MLTQSDRADRMRLDVGGAIFVTSRATLTRYSDSFFGKLVDGSLPAPPSGEPLFIDRDGTNFRYILNFLRDGRLPLSTMSVQLRKELLQEAEFYQLGTLTEALQSTCCPLAGVSDDNIGSSSGTAMEAQVPTKVLQVLPSMGAVTTYALAWDANRQTIAQCQAEAQRETGGMVELVPLSNDASISFPLAEKNNADKRVSKWFNPMVPLWRRVRELQQQGYVLSGVHCGPEHTISFVVLTLPQNGNSAPLPISGSNAFAFPAD